MILFLILQNIHMAESQNYKKGVNREVWLPCLAPPPFNCHSLPCLRDNGFLISFCFILSLLLTCLCTCIPLPFLTVTGGTPCLLFWPCISEVMLIPFYDCLTGHSVHVPVSPLVMAFELFPVFAVTDRAAMDNLEHMSFHNSGSYIWSIAGSNSKGTSNFCKTFQNAPP